MSIYEIIIIGFALALDAFAVTVSNCATYKQINKYKLLLMPVLFTVFQGLMPVIGYYAGTTVSGFVNKYSDFIAFAIFFILATKILYDIVSDYLKSKKGELKIEEKGSLTIKLLVLQAVATSIDALAVGITFISSSVNIFIAMLLIMAVTAVVLIIGVLLGRFLGDKLGNKAQIIGMLILYIVSIKSLVEGIQGLI